MNVQNNKYTLLVVEDDPGFLDLITLELEEQGYTVFRAESLAAARKVIEKNKLGIDLVVSDLRLSDGNGGDLLKDLKSGEMPPSFIALTAFGSIGQAVELLKAGAENFLTKPLDLGQLKISVERALEYREMRFELNALAASSGPSGFHGMIGDSPSMRKLIYEIRRVARTDEAVLLIGESGTGKELAARAIHMESRRSTGSFIPVNCAAIPSELVESDFFGHKKGAFTGADGNKEGLFKAADGGTLFLDEIGDLPLDVQAKLLRVLQEGTIRPVGTSHEIPVDARIIAATHRDLNSAMEAQQFRDDLFYRLEALSLRLPPLRERGDDVEKISLAILSKLVREMKLRDACFDPAVIRAFRGYSFPGNIRELENVIKKMLVFHHDAKPLGRELLPTQIRAFEVEADAEGDTGADGFLVEPPFPPLESVKRSYVEHVLRSNGGNKRQAARQLDIGRRTLYDILDRDRASPEE